MSCCVDVFLSTVTTPHFSTRRFRCVIYSTMSAVIDRCKKKFLTFFIIFIKTRFLRGFWNVFYFLVTKFLAY